MKRLTQEQRYLISRLRAKKESQRATASYLGVSHSTVSREIRRNTGSNGYDNLQAHEKAKTRRKIASRVCRKLTATTIQIINQLLQEEQWSPVQISAYLKKLNINISHETIYRHIKADRKNKGSLYKNLRRKGKRYRKKFKNGSDRSLIPNRVSIEKRPEIVKTKSRIGDFELDTIVGAKHKGAIVSIVDRKSKFVKLVLLDKSSAKNVAAAITDSLLPFKDCVKTLTSDNGREFTNHQDVSEQLQAKFFFARPYHSWERGLNENTNGLVRQYFPKKFDFRTITQAEVSAVETKLNSRPRKTLNFKTPKDVFFSDFFGSQSGALAC